MLKIRLSQTGSRNRRMYRIVAIDENKRRNGRPVATLGYFNPKVKPAMLKIDQTQVKYWQSKGAVLTDGVANLLTQSQS